MNFHWIATVFRMPVFNLGFRIFFVSAAMYSVVSMGLWLILYAFGWFLWPFSVPQYWHGRELLLGYAFAVIAGFLLTAVQNWTGVAMPSGKKLFDIWLIWVLARLSALFSAPFIYISMILDSLFSIVLIWVVMKACHQVDGQLKRQAGIIAKLWLILIVQWFLNVAMFFQHWVWIQILLYAIAWLIIGLVLTIGRRVLPFFTQNGLKSMNIEFVPYNNEKIDIWCLRLFLLFFIFGFFKGQDWAEYPLAISAFLVGLLNLKRLLGWYHSAIWRLPLLWTLFLSFFGLIFGLFLFALQPFLENITPSLALHAMTLSGMGLMVISMMGRVGLGHTGRNIHQPSRLFVAALFLMLGVFFSRVILPLIMPEYSQSGFIWAQSFWIISFLLFILVYFPILTRVRPDGKLG